MEGVLEIRWHGRGGQGVKTAALLLADVAFFTGKQVQGFPEYGPERMGAPVTAYNRISDEEILIHSNIYEPDYVAVVDESLLSTVAVTGGLSEKGAVLVNTAKSPAQVAPLLNGYKGQVLTIDAGKISEEVLGANFPNMPMLAAVVKMTNLLPEKVFMENMEDSLKHKFATKPKMVEGNMQVLRRSFGEVQGL
ncbi:MAG: 2-oxoacid:acceptor oxidoreductase family protein [Clostridiales bacterium]